MSVIAGEAIWGSHHTQCAEHFYQDPWVPDEEQHNKLCMHQPKKNVHMFQPVKDGQGHKVKVQLYSFLSLVAGKLHVSGS